MLYSIIKSEYGIENGVALEVATYQPISEKPLATIILSTGICMCYQDYISFLEPLFNQVSFVGYNYRGHGISTGVFDPDKVSSDLDSIASNFSGPIFYMGHSTGASVSAGSERKVNGHILLCPYIDRSYLAKPLLWGLNSLKFLAKPLTLVDSLLTSTGIARKIGFKNQRPLVDVSKIHQLQSPLRGQEKMPAMWMIADRDEILGTWKNPSHLEYIREKLRTTYPMGLNASRAVEGLNHLFNPQVGNIFQMANCGEDRRKQILETILEFCKANIK